MAFLFIFLFLFIILFFVSRKLFKNLFLILIKIINKEKAIHLLSWLFLPGTIIHELSHMLIAEVLRVKTGQFNFTPQITSEEKRIRVGSLQVAKTDPIRRTLIGLAPAIVGLVIIFYLTNSLLFPLTSQLTIKQFSNSAINQFLLLAVYCYSLFIISNTMFSSKKDLEAALFPLILFFLLTASLWMGNFHISLSQKAFNKLVLFFKTLNKGLSLAILTDLFMLVILSLSQILIKQRNHNQN